MFLGSEFANASARCSRPEVGVEVPTATLQRGFKCMHSDANRAAVITEVADYCEIAS